jgi:hypothetical protein
MTSVTGRIKEIKQPRGGYIKPSTMDVVTLDDGKTLNENENISASKVGTVVDYMTRFMMGTDILDAFKISIIGAQCAEELTGEDAIEEIGNYLKEIKGLDDNSIINACNAISFDIWYRNPVAAPLFSAPAKALPDKDTMENIKILVERSLKFFEEYGPVTADGFTFEGGGYTDTVNKGDGDFLTEDTLWDFKVSGREPKSAHTLQLLMYYIMGKHSNKPEFKNIKNIGIFNPRLNKIYLYNMKNLSPDIIKEIEDNVICY